MIVNRDIKKYWEINILSDILSMSYVAEIVTLCPGTVFDRIPILLYTIKSKS